MAQLVGKLTSADKQQQRKLDLLYSRTKIRSRYTVLPDFKKENVKGKLAYKPVLFDFFSRKKFVTPGTGKRMAVYEYESLQIAAQAAQDCLKDYNKNRITHIITVSCTGLMAPGLETQLIQALKLPVHTQRFAINFVGCYAAFQAIRLANSICQSQEDASVLIVCAEICSLHFNADPDAEQQVANALFGDGAAAIVIESQPEEKGIWKLTDAYSRLLAQTNQEMSWQVTDVGFKMGLSTEVPALLSESLEKAVQTYFKKDVIRDIDFWAVHPGGRKILEAAQKSFDITEQDLWASYQVLANYGNMSSATILFIFKEMMERQALPAGESIMALGFGPGLTVEMARFVGC